MTIRLPLHADASDKEQILWPHPFLVIDDDLSIRRLLRSSLRERGYRVSVAATGEEGLDLAGATRRP